MDAEPHKSNLENKKRTGTSVGIKWLGGGKDLRTTRSIAQIPRGLSLMFSLVRMIIYSC